MGKIVKFNQPCPNPTCGSSNGAQIYEEGTGFCFVCKTFLKAEDFNGEFKPKPEGKKHESKETVESIGTYPIRGFDDRKLPLWVCEFFKVHCSYGSDGKVDHHYYPYGDGYNVRFVPNKDC